MNGGVVTPLGTSNPGGLLGKILVVYKTAADATHTTTWKLDGGSTRSVQSKPGTPVSNVAVGAHTVTFTAPAGDTNPPTQNFSVVAGQQKTLEVYYS